MRLEPTIHNSFEETANLRARKSAARIGATAHGISVRQASCWVRTQSCCIQTDDLGAFCSSTQRQFSYGSLYECGTGENIGYGQSAYSRCSTYPFARNLFSPGSYGSKIADGPCPTDINTGLQICPPVEPAANLKSTVLANSSSFKSSGFVPLSTPAFSEATIESTSVVASIFSTQTPSNGITSSVKTSTSPTPTPVQPSSTPSPSLSMGASSTQSSSSQSEPTPSSIQTSDVSISSEREARAPQTYSSSAATSLYDQRNQSSSSQIQRSTSSLQIEASPSSFEQNKASSTASSTSPSSSKNTPLLNTSKELPQTYSLQAASSLYSQALETIFTHESSSSLALHSPSSSLIWKTSDRPLFATPSALAIAGGAIISPAAIIGSTIAAAVLILVGTVAVIGIVVYCKKKNNNRVVPQLQSHSVIENPVNDYLLMEDLESSPVKPNRPKSTHTLLGSRTNSARSVEHTAAVAAAHKNNIQTNWADDDSFDEEYWINLTAQGHATPDSTLEATSGEDVGSDGEDSGVERGVDPALVRCFQTAFNPTSHADGTQTVLVMPKEIFLHPKKNNSHALPVPLNEQAVTDL